MLVRNKSSKIIGINETSILPGDTQKVPEGYEKNPVVLKYIANGTFAVVKPVKSAKNEKTQKDPAEGTKKRMITRAPVKSRIQTVSRASRQARRYRL